MKRKIVALSIILVSSSSNGNFNESFLENIDDVIHMEFSDGSLYRGR